jgi:FSR family fosmidomycin resistance protein-like MFS transporter
MGRMDILPRTMLGFDRVLAPVRGLGRERLAFLGFVTGGHTVVHWYQQIFSVVLPSISQSLGLSDVQVGYLQSMRQLTSGTLNLPVGILADAFGRHQAAMLGSALAFMGLGYYVMGAAGGLAGALLGAALVGLGSAIWHPPAMGALSVRFPERRATVLAIHGVGATIADTLTPVAVGALLVAFAWPAVLRAQLLPAVVAGLLLWRGLAGQFRQAAAPPSGQSLVEDVRAILVDPVFMAVSFAQGLMMMARQVILTFLPLYIQIGLGRNAFELGIYVALLHGMGTVSQPILGVLSDRVGRKAVLVPSYLILAGLYLLLARVAPGWPLGLLVLTIGVFFYTLTNVTTAATLDAAGTRVQASAFGVASVVTQVIVLPAPVLAGWLVERWGYGSAFTLSAGFMGIGALLMLPLRLYRGTGWTPRAGG